MDSYLKAKVESIEVGRKSISQLLSEMARTAFQGRRLGEAFELWEEMLREKDLTIIMGLAGSLSTAGQWKMINWLIERRFIDVLVPTGANISEDIVEALGFSYWRGSPDVDDGELLMADLNRYYDVYGREADYRRMEDLIADFILTLDPNRIYSSLEFLYLFGKWLSGRGIRSIVAVAAENGVPVFCPAICDSPYGEAFLIAKSRGHNLMIDQMKDFYQFVGLIERVADTGVIYIGGGVPKDVTQILATSLSLRRGDGEISHKRGINRRTVKEHCYPHKYAIQITTDSPQWGGLSGCTLDEAVSWGKVAEGGRRVTCYCDATIALPLITHALMERINFKREGPDFSWFFNRIG